MKSLRFNGIKTVLCLGAHADDIEIGCGGTILRLLQEQPGLSIRWVVFSAHAARKREARSSARTFLKGAGRQQITVKNFRDTYFPAQGEVIKGFFQELKAQIEPDLVFTHFLHDRHQDHRILSELTWNTFRNHVVLEYEIPKFEGDLSHPNLFVPLAHKVCADKVSHLCRFFQTQTNKHWFSEDLFYGLMRLRGVECASPTRYAEAFHCRKMII